MSPLIQIISTQVSYLPISWESHRHYNTTTTLTYHNKSTSIYNYTTLPKNTFLRQDTKIQQLNSVFAGKQK